MKRSSLSDLLAAMSRLRLLHPDVHKSTYIIYGRNPRHPGAVGIGWDGIEVWHEDAEIAIDRLICAVAGIQDVEKMRAESEGVK